MSLVGLRRERAEPAAHVTDVAAVEALLVEVVGEDEGCFRRSLDDLERTAKLADVLLLALATDGFLVRRGRVYFDVRAHLELLEKASSRVQAFSRSAAHVVGVVGGDLDVR